MSLPSSSSLSSLPLDNSNLSSLNIYGVLKSWQAQSSNYIANVGDRILVDSSSNSWTLTLPSSPSVGQEVDLFVVQGLDKNPVIINPNGAKFQGTSALVKLVKNGYLKLIYTGENIGWVGDTTKLLIDQTQLTSTPLPVDTSTSVSVNASTSASVQVPTVFLLDKYPGAKFAYSFRRLSSSYLGPAIKIKQNGVELDVNFNSQGTLDTNLNLSNFDVIKWYDQSGNNNHLVVPNSNQAPQLIIDSSGKPTIKFTASKATKLELVMPNSISASTLTTFCIGSISSDSISYARFVSIGTNGKVDYDNDTSSALIARFENNQALGTYRNNAAQFVDILYNKAYLLKSFLSNQEISLATNNNAFKTANRNFSSSLNFNKIALGNSIQNNSPTSPYENLSGMISEVVIYDSLTNKEASDNIAQDINSFYKVY